jgi:hypothetical protein
VYNDEINLIEVELLGREHYERMQRDRQVAEETGAAQLQRLQENILQTRIKYNRAKHQYYFPAMKGFKYVFTGFISCCYLYIYLSGKCFVFFFLKSYFLKIIFR